jgi:hypothetical protein
LTVEGLHVRATLGRIPGTVVKVTVDVDVNVVVTVDVMVVVVGEVMV